MADELNNSDAPPPPPDPVCPYCLADPALVTVRGPIMMGTMIGMIIYCGNPECRKIWTVEIVGKQEGRVAPARGMIHTLH